MGLGPCAGGMKSLLVAIQAARLEEKSGTGAAVCAPAAAVSAAQTMQVAQTLQRGMNLHIVAFPCARRDLRLSWDVNELEPAQSMTRRGVRHVSCDPHLLVRAFSRDRYRLRPS